MAAVYGGLNSIGFSKDYLSAPPLYIKKKEQDFSLSFFYVVFRGVSSDTMSYDMTRGWCLCFLLLSLLI